MTEEYFVVIHLFFFFEGKGIFKISPNPKTISVL